MVQKREIQIQYIPTNNKYREKIHSWRPSHMASSEWPRNSLFWIDIKSKSYLLIRQERVISLVNVKSKSYLLTRVSYISCGVQYK